MDAIEAISKLENKQTYLLKAINYSKNILEKYYFNNVFLNSISISNTEIFDSIKTWWDKLNDYNLHPSVKLLTCINILYFNKINLILKAGNLGKFIFNLKKDTIVYSGIIKNGKKENCINDLIDLEILDSTEIFDKKIVYNVIV